MTQDLLFEIGCEELPATQIDGLSQHLSQDIAAALKKEAFAFETVEYFSTPRRLAFLIRKLSATSATQMIEKRGPAVAQAFNAEGKPSMAAIKFAESCGVAVEQLEKLETDKGAWLMYRGQQAGVSIVEKFPALISQTIAKLPLNKKMRWGQHSAQFLRPVHWLVAMYGDQVIEFNLLEKTAGRITHGHRFMSAAPIELKNASDYEAELLKNYVVANFQTRQAHINKQIQQQAASVNGAASTPENLLNEVTGLVEWPAVLMGQFEKAFLTVPHEALTSTMMSNQKYFPIYDQQSKLTENFLIVSNIESQDPHKVIAGNEKVIRPRFSDAQFFFEQDKKQPLESYNTALKNVVFQNKLGTVFDKAERVAKLAKFIAEQLKFPTPELAYRAGLLCKADLMTNMVNEFPELQGIMGKYYAQSSGENEAVAIAIEEHYLPRFAHDKIPETPIGTAISIADKLDSLVGLFGISQPPTGDKDPFALRRAALGILKIFFDRQVDLDLAVLLSEAEKNYAKLEITDTQIQVLNFINSRYRTWYAERGIPVEVTISVEHKTSTKPLDFDSRIQAVNHFRQLTEAPALIALNKRVSNIIKKSSSDTPFVHSLLTEPAEINLANALLEKEKVANELLAKRKYEDFLKSLISLDTVVSDFFEHVMVNVEEVTLRNNRLALLKRLNDLFVSVADLSALNL